MKLAHIALGAAIALAPAANSQDCTVENYGPSCGPVANGSVEPNGAGIRFAFTVSNALPRNPVLLVVGARQISEPLFDSGCLLLATLDFFQYHRTDAAGTYTFSHQLPGGPGGFVGSAYVQFVEYRIDGNDLIVRSTNGVRLTCQ